MRSRISVSGFVRPAIPSSVGRSQTRKWAEFEQHQEHKRQFRDKYAGRSPERICCPNSVRLVFQLETRVVAGAAVVKKYCEVTSSATLLFTMSLSNFSASLFLDGCVRSLNFREMGRI